MRGVLVAVLGLLTAACTHSVHQYTVSGTMPPPGTSARPIAVQSEQSVIIATSEYLLYDDAYRKLLASCPHGEIVGVRVKHWTDHGFLSWTQKFRIEGNCLQTLAAP